MAEPQTNLVTRPKPIQHNPDLVRPAVAGDDAGPQPPFPVYLEGWVTRGFGRGSKDLGCPTANLPDSSIAPYATTLSTGVYFGYARVLDPALELAGGQSAFPDGGVGGEAAGESEQGVHDEVHPMVMSIGWNPFYNNDTRTAEVHILHEYPSDFYGKELRVVMLGFIRPEYNYSSMDALIKDIDTDKLVALASVARSAYLPFQSDAFFSRKSTLEPPTEDPTKPRVKPGEEEA
ncbi:hypothetical protein JCM6882_004061 [Rhodosporidiobolus microsporus]